MVLAAATAQTQLLLYALAAVVGLVVLVARFKVNSFVALILASLFVGLCSDLSLAELGKGFQEGVGKVLGDIAMIVGLGTLLGKLLAESGGVRLHEANAGLIAVSEVMRALLDVRAAGIPVVVLIGGANGCFGGMGIVARCADHVVMSDIGRLAMSGPEVIEASHGVEEFDSRDRALVWRTSGGKHRYLTGDCEQLVDDDVQAFRAAAITALTRGRPLSLDSLEEEHALLAQRLAAAADARDAIDLWQAIGIAQAAGVPDMNATQVRALRSREEKAQ